MVSTCNLLEPSTQLNKKLQIDLYADSCVFFLLGEDFTYLDLNNMLGTSKNKENKLSSPKACFKMVVFTVVESK